MVDIRSIIADHKSRSSSNVNEVSKESGGVLRQDGQSSTIPDIFFDHILKNFRLTRIEIMTLLYFYRQIWCRPNLYQAHGISDLRSYESIIDELGIELDEFHSAVRNLEKYELIEVIRPGQYFVRKFFTRVFDEKFQQSYDDFEI